MERVYNTFRSEDKEREQKVNEWEKRTKRCGRKIWIFERKVRKDERKRIKEGNKRKFGEENLRRIMKQTIGRKE